MIAGCCLGSDPGLSSVNRVWKMIVCDLKRTANVNIHARYVSEGMHVFYYWLKRPINQRRNWIWSPACPCLCECSLCLCGNHRKKRWGENIAKSIKIDSMNKYLVFIAPSSVGPREYPIKLASGQTLSKQKEEVNGSTSWVGCYVANTFSSHVIIFSEINGSASTISWRAQKSLHKG